jgi:hypothetical protein
MRHEFTNDTPIAIPGDSKITVESRIQLSGVSSPIRDVNVTVDLDHSWTNDLRIVLEAPDGTRVKLVEREGGPGTREGHWRESSFGNELMTGFLNPGETPLSRLTIAALRDMGYEVNMDAADAFDIPDSMGLRMFRATSRHTCRTVAPKPEILPG